MQMICQEQVHWLTQSTAVDHNELNPFWKAAIAYVNLMQTIMGLEPKPEEERSVKREICGKLEPGVWNSGSKLLKMWCMMMCLSYEN